MRHKHISFRLFITSCFLLFAASCHKKEDKPNNSEVKATYFSIKNFAHDQFNTYMGTPFTFTKIVEMNGRRDSSIVNMYEVDWGAILKTFFESDISEKKYIGRYNFTVFDDDGNGTRNYYYEAKEPDLFTRKLQIVADQLTNKVRYIYIETFKKTGWNERTQKLYYAPLKTIQIQEFEKSKPGPGKKLLIEYRFIV